MDLNKGELVETVAAETGSSKSEAQNHVDAVLSAIEAELASGGEVNITGFGKFTVQEREAREGRNPATGEKMQIKASKTPKFTAGNALKKSVS